MNSEKMKAKDFAYDKIKNMIVTNELAPGELISENALAKTLGISRTPIREAIFILEAEGFINTIPNKGSVVVKFDMEDIIEFMQIREALEGIAARIAADRGNTVIFEGILEELEEIKDTYDETQVEIMLSIGRRLHKEILMATGNSRLQKMLDNLYSQLDRIMVLSRNEEKRLQISHDEHIVIAKAIIERNPELAEKSMRNHIIGATNGAIKAYHQSYR